MFQQLEPVVFASIASRVKVRIENEEPEIHETVVELDLNGDDVFRHLIRSLKDALRDRLVGLKLLAHLLRVADTKGVEHLVMGRKELEVPVELGLDRLVNLQTCKVICGHIEIKNLYENMNLFLPEGVIGGRFGVYGTEGVEAVGAHSRPQDQHVPPAVKSEVGIIGYYVARLVEVDVFAEAAEGVGGGLANRGFRQ